MSDFGNIESVLMGKLLELERNSSLFIDSTEGFSIDSIDGQTWSVRER